MIRFNRCIDDIRTYQTGDLPDTAVRIETPRTVDDTMKHAAPIAAVLCLIVSLTVFAKVFFARAAAVFARNSAAGGFRAQSG